MEKLKVHEYAKLFPPMEGEEFDALVADIRDHGLVEPIVVLDGAIVDGRNRYRACQKAGVEPKVVRYQGNGLLDFIVSKNVRRRHLNESQRAVIALEYEKLEAKEAAKRAAAGREAGGAKTAEVARSGLAGIAAGKPRGRAQNESRVRAAEKLHVGGRTVGGAKRVAREAPDLIPEIRAGKLTVSEAERKVRERAVNRVVERRVAKAKAEKRQNEPREVAIFLTKLKTYHSATGYFRDDLQTAREVAEFGKFSPEAKQFTIRKLETLEADLADMGDRITALKGALK